MPLAGPRNAEITGTRTRGKMWLVLIPFWALRNQTVARHDFLTNSRGTETREIPGNVRALQTILFESKGQMLTWWLLSCCIYRDKTRHTEKVGGKIVAVKIVFYSMPHAPFLHNPQYTFSLLFRQQHYNQNKISFRGQDFWRGVIWIKTVKSQ